MTHAEISLYRHLRRILALADRYGREEVAAALAHALRHQAFGADYVERILEQERRRQNREPLPPLRSLDRPPTSPTSPCPRSISPSTTRSSERETSMKPNPNERLEENLRRLNLLRILEIYPKILRREDPPKSGLLAVLDRLFEEEARARFERIVLRRLKEARIPVPKTLDGFDFNHPKKIDRAKVLRLFDLDFMPRSATSCFIARSGVGKTHLASALCHAACHKGYRVLFSTAVNVVNQLQAAQGDGTFLRRLRHYLSPDVLCLDELGYLPIDRHGADLLFQVISGRYERGSVILTTNRPFKEWASVFHDATVADAVINRIAHHSEVVIIEGRSFRLPPEACVPTP